jgi:hypothetical protein
MRYEIRLAGQLPSNWTDWCGGFTRTVLETGETVLSGSVPDQSALIGLLSAICQMNLTLLSVRHLDRNQV